MNQPTIVGSENSKIELVCMGFGKPLEKEMKLTGAASKTNEGSTELVFTDAKPAFLGEDNNIHTTEGTIKPVTDPSKNAYKEVKNNQEKNHRAKKTKSLEER